MATRRMFVRRPHVGVALTREPLPTPAAHPAPLAVPRRVYAVIASYVHGAGAAMAEYVPAVVSCCVEALQREEAAKAAGACLLPLTQLVQRGVFTGEALQADRLVEVPMKLLRVNTSKLAPSFRGAHQLLF